MSTPDPLAVLKRADQRWATKRADDPAEVAYLQHLADAVTPLLNQPAPAPVADTGEVKRLRGELAEARADTQRRVDRAAQASKKAVDEAHAKIDELRIDLATAKRECDDAVLQLAETTSALDALGQTRDTATDQLRALQADQPAVAELTALLGRLVDAITTEWQPTGDLAVQVDLAVELVAAASAQISEWHAKTHVHQYPREGDRIKPCACGRRFPKSAKAGLTAAASRGVA